MSHHNHKAQRGFHNPRGRQDGFKKPWVPKGWDEKRAQDFIDQVMNRYGGHGASGYYTPGKGFRFAGFYAPLHMDVLVPEHVSPNRAMRVFEETIVDMPLAGCPEVWAPGPS